MPRVRPAGVFLLLISAMVACSKKDDGATSLDATTQDSLKANDNIALPVVGEPVRKGDLILTVNATGQIRTDATTSLKAETGGTVTAVLVRPGDKVAKGQELVRLDSVPLMLDLRSAQAQLSTAKLNYRIEIEPDSIGGVPVSNAKRQFAIAKSGLEMANIAVDRAKLALDHVSVRAPYDGVIEKVSVATGDRIGAGAEVAVIVDLMNLRVEAQVLEHDIPLLRVGGDAQITVAAMPDKLFHGTISAILPLVDSVSRAGRAAIRLKGDGMLRPGMYADIRLEANRLPNRIIVPAKAIVERDNRPLVFVVKDGQANWVYIQPGRTNTRETEILPDSATGLIPLKPGDIVLTEGHLTLTHQAPVRLTEKRETGH